MKVFDYKSLGMEIQRNIENFMPENDGMIPIIETDMTLNVSDVIIANGIAYLVCRVVESNAYVERLKDQTAFQQEKEPTNKYFRDNITCPYCGYEMESWEMPEEDDDCLCKSCGSTFAYQRHVTIQYDSQPVKKTDVIQLT